MKKVLILVVSSQNEPYEQMWLTSRNTWDKDEVKNAETVFYFSRPLKKNTNKEIYFDLEETLFTMGEKTLMAFEWSLLNRNFDYIARVNSSTYVNKKELIKYIQTLPDSDVFAGLVVDEIPKWMWGPSFIISKDVVQKMVGHKNLLDKTKMEDVGISYLANQLEIQYTDGRACTIEKTGDNWRCIGYGSESFYFTDWQDVKKLDNQFFYRCKQDNQRYIEQFIFEQLKQVLE